MVQAGGSDSSYWRSRAHFVLHGLVLGSRLAPNPNHHFTAMVPISCKRQDRMYWKFCICEVISCVHLIIALKNIMKHQQKTIEYIICHKATGTRKPVELYTSHFNPVSRAVLTLHSSPSMQAEVLFFPKLCRNSPPNFGGNQNLETKHG